MSKLFKLGLTLLFVLTANAATSAFARPPRLVDDNDTISLRGNVHRLARPEFDRGETERSWPMERMILSLRRSPDNQAALEKTLVEQHDPRSVNYHRWLTPEEFGRQFGPRQEEVAAVTGWLNSHGFTVDEVAKGGGAIVFSGSVDKVERAFHTSIHDYAVDGHLRHANARDPSIPRGLSDLVGGVVSLHSFPRKTMNSGVRGVAQGDVQPDYTTRSGTHFLSPGDFAKIYNLTSLYSAGIDGTGQSIAIVGRTHPSSSNWATFRTTMGLPSKSVQVILNGADPGDLGAGEDGEADLDVEWAGAVARNATINFVVSKSTSATDGIDLSAQYIVTNNLSPVMSTSFGSCESDMGAAENSFYNNLWQQATAQGIPALVSSGDSGAAGCNGGSDTVGTVSGVNGLASTPYNVAVGGTQFNDGAGGYWNASNGAGDTSAIGYIPETAWNESGNVSGGSGLWATGGGVSLTYARPSWQTAPGVPAGNKRSVPDVSLSAASHDGYLVQTQGSLSSVGGTSASSPSFAGLMALVVQQTGQRQGNANVRFYQLGTAQFSEGGAPVYHDVTAGNNSVPGVAGYSSTAGYDLATGLGSVDANVLVGNWSQSTATYTLSYTAGANGTISGTTPQTIVSGGTGSQVTAIANAGYHFVSWSDGVTTAARKEANVTADLSVTASFAITTYTLTYTAGSNGTISGSTPQTVNPGGSGTQVTAVANSGYHFLSWSDGITTANRTDTNVTADLSVTGSFAPNSVTLSYAAGANGSINGSTPQTVDYGGNGSQVTAVPGLGYHFLSWSDGVATASRTDANVTANLSVTGSFAINSYTLTYGAGSNGSVSGSTSQTVNYGGSGTQVTAVANTGYHFVSWSDGITTASRTDAAVSANLSVTASFAINSYTLAYGADANGGVSGNTPQTVNFGGSATQVTAVASTGYHFVSWSDGVTTASRTDANVTANLSVTASFAINSYLLTYGAGANGGVNGNTQQTVNYGGSGTQVTAIASTGYHFLSWNDGVTSASRTDANLTANLSATAVFAVNSYSVGFTAGVNGALTGTTGQVVTYAASTSAVTAVPDAGYYFVNWTDDSGQAAGTANPLVVTDVTSVRNFTANFTAIDGILIPAPGKTGPDINDALRVLQIVSGQVAATANDRAHADVAPLGANKKPKGDGVIDVYDVIGILRMVVGLI